MPNHAHEPRDRTQRREHRNAPECTAMPPFAPNALAAAQIRVRSTREMHPNAPRCTQMHPPFAIWQNKPTAGPNGTFGHICVRRPARPVDAGLRQLTSVDAGLPQHVIWQNEPTAAHVGTFRRLRREARATSCNAMQRHATGRYLRMRFGKTNPPIRRGRSATAMSLVATTTTTMARQDGGGGQNQPCDARGLGDGRD